jgi:hypothetical protein
MTVFFRSRLSIVRSCTTGNMVQMVIKIIDEKGLHGETHTAIVQKYVKINLNEDKENMCIFDVSI